MRNRPTEVDLGIRDLLPSNLEDLGVTEAAAINVRAFVGHEHAFLMDEEVNEFKGHDALAIRPASLKVGITVEAIVQGLVK